MARRTVWGKKSLVPNLTQVHLQHELESNNYGVFLSDNDLSIKVKRMVYLSGRSDFKTRRNNCAAQLPRIFFVHFRPTSFAAQEHDRVVGFLAGFVSQSDPSQAYIHFVAIHPDHRKRGFGR